MKKKERRKLAVHLSALLLSVAFLLPTFPVRAMSSTGTPAREITGERTRVQELYTVGNTSYENNSSINKGNRHDCQHLGLWIPAGVTFKIRQVNTAFGQTMTFKLRNDDRLTEEVFDLNKDGSWLEVTPKADSVPFISSLYSSNGEKPQVEFTLEGTQELPVYTYGDDETAFFQKWDALDAPFAVYLSKQYAIFLVPARDKKSNHVGSLDDLLLWYDNMVAQYNAFSGLSLDAAEEWNRDSGTRYFIKANKNGYGAAYYSVVETAPNSDTLAAYMETSNWGPLHEVGHGYDTVNFGSAEIWNNVLSHYYQVAALGQGNWLHLDDEWRQKFEDDLAKVGGYFQSKEYATKLYFWVNMLDKLGPQKTSAYAYRLYRWNQVNGTGNLSGHSFYADAYTRASGYNVTPWFDLWGFTIEESVREELIEEQLYQNIYALNHLVSEENAKQIQEALGLESRYSMVETGQMVAYGKTHAPITGTLTIQLDELAYQQLQGKTLRITDGVDTVETVTINAAQQTLTLHSGVYDLLFPAPTDETVLLEGRVGYVVVKEGGTATYAVTAQRLGQGSNQFVDWTITFASNFSYWNTYCTATTDLANGTLRVETVSCSPHTYFGKSTFSSIRVYDANGKLVYEKLCPGENVTAEDKTISIAPGYTIELYHAEPSRGHKVYSSAANSLMPVDGSTMGTAVQNSLFRVTEYGLEQLDPTTKAVKVSGEENYYTVLTTYMDALKASHRQADFQDVSKFPEEKAKVTLAVEKLSESRKAQFQGAYLGYYPFNTGVQSLTLSPIPVQSYTGGAVEPTLTVSAAGVTLTAGEYQAEWYQNTDVGTAKVKVYGLGDYANYSGEAQFQIRLDVAEGAHFTVTVEPGDPGFYDFSGGAKRPAAEVTLGSTTLTRGVDYLLRYENNVNVGTAKVVAEGMGNYAGLTGEASFTIRQKTYPLTVTALPDKLNYTGSAVEPEVEVRAGQWKLTQGTDYTVSYKDNVDVGTATIQVTGLGNYAGSTGTGTFRITAPLTPQPIGATELANWTYELSSWVSGRLSTMSFDLAEGLLTVEHTHAQPHSNFGESPYVSVAVYDTAESLVYQKKYIGNKDNYAPADEIPLGLGYRVELYVAEPERNDTYAHADAFPTVGMRPKTATYEVTARGLRELTTDGSVSTTDPSSHYPAVLGAYMDQLKSSHAQSEFWDSGSFPDEKAVVEKAVSLLTATELTQFKRDYAGYYPFTRPTHSGGSGGGSSSPASPAPTETPSQSPDAGTQTGVERFEDVKQSDYYYESVQWAVEKGITTGLTEKTFAPDQPCVRSQLITFLWRAAGSPEPEGDSLPFVDVKEDAYYYKAVLWALEQGITAGTGKKTFSPQAKVTRGQMATLLYRAQGNGESGHEQVFEDVAEGDYYAEAVAWAAANGITTGTVPGLFSPGEDCIRGQIVTMLYRAAR